MHTHDTTPHNMHATHDLLDDRRRRVQVDQALVNAHLVAVERGRTVTARRLAHRVRQNLGRQTHGALDLETLVLGALQQVGAHCTDV